MNSNSTKARIIKTACVYVGIIFGAGFASGQEHLTFFLRYGAWGVVGVLIAAVLIGLCGWAVMDICVRQKISNYKDFMAAVFGKQLGGILDIVTGTFVFVMFTAMLAGIGAMGNEAFGLPSSVGIIAAAALVFAVLLFDLRGMVDINTAVSPLLVAGSLLVGLIAIFSETRPVFANALGNSHAMWPVGALVYASYNMITAAAVLSSMPQLVNSRKVAKYGGIIGGIALGGIGVVIAIALFINMSVGGVSGAQLPMLALAAGYSPLLEYFYFVLLFLAIFTTAATGGFSLVQWLTARTGVPKSRAKIGIVLCGIAAAHVGFSNIVSHAYSFFGFLGLFIMTAIIVCFVRNFHMRRP